MTRSVLLIHNYYQSSSPSGENYAADLDAGLLARNGVRVTRFTRRSDEIRSYSLLRRAAVSHATIWSIGSRRALRQQLDSDQPDIVHIHNTFPLISPSVLSIAGGRATAVVVTLHNYRLACPSAVYYRDGHVCEDCAGRMFPWPGVLHGCYRNSRAASAVVGTTIGLHRALGSWTRNVDLFVAVSAFARAKYIEMGLSSDRIVVRPNFVDPDPGIGTHDGAFVLFAGRLSEEKGVATLLDAWALLPTTIPLKIAGDGELRELVRRAADRNPAISWLGTRTPDEVAALMGAATIVVVPSAWYETFGRVVIEAYARGTPVVASDIGAVRELVDDGVTGLLVRPADAVDLAAKVARLWSWSERLPAMRTAARSAFVSQFTAAQGLKNLDRIYDEAMESAAARQT